MREHVGGFAHATDAERPWPLSAGLTRIGS